MAGLLDQLPERQYGDIAIQPFCVVYDGVTFGLIDESDAERGDWAELCPDRLGFTEPWDDQIVRDADRDRWFTASEARD